MEKPKTKKCKKCREEIDIKAKKCPHCRANQGIPVWLIIIIVIFGLGIIANIGDNSDNKSSNSKAKQKEIEYTKVTKDDLDEALKNNAAVAKDTYDGKYVEISGKLGTIDSDLKYISLMSSTNKYDFNGVYCRIKDKKQKETVKTLTKGQKIIVKGKITDVGEVLGYYLDITEIKAD
jgi:hypothetical protein